MRMGRHPTSILGLDGDDALTLWPEALSGPGLHLELVRNVLTEARYRQPTLKVVSIHPECGGLSYTGKTPSAPGVPFHPPHNHPTSGAGGTSSLGHLTGHQVAKDIPVGPPRPLPAQLQGVWTEGGEHQRARGTGGAQSEGRAWGSTGRVSVGGGWVGGDLDGGRGQPAHLAGGREGSAGAPVTRW